MKPVNLNKFRKTKARADQKARANENAVKFGRTKTQKDALDLERARTISRLEDHSIKDQTD